LVKYRSRAPVGVNVRHRIVSRPTISQSPAMQVEQRRRFAASSLPQTMELASVLKAIIVPHLRQSSRRWPYHDRVLAWIAPSLLDHICRFHDFNGPALSELKSEKALKLLDTDFLSELAQNVERIRPGVIQLLQELSAASSADDDDA